jgi:hypothetical protein
MAYTFKDPISIIPDDLGLVRTAKMVRDTREFNRFDTDNIYAMLNTAQVAPGDEWIINQLHEEVDEQLGSVVASGNYFGATNAVAQSASLLKNSKGLKLAAQSYAQYQKSKEIEDKLNAQYGSSLNFSEKKWQNHSSYYQDVNGKWVENVFDYDVQRELDYNAEMIRLIGNINADGGGISFKKHKVSPGDIRDFMYNSKGISKSKAKRVALALADAYLNGAVGTQDYRKLTELDINPTTGLEHTHEEALEDISQRLIDIASRQVYWDASVTELKQRQNNSGNTNTGGGIWTPTQGSAINGGLSWNDTEEYTTSKVNALEQLFATTGDADADLNSKTSARTVLNTLRNQETLIVNNFADSEVVAAYNEMSNAFNGHENLRDLLHHLTINTSSTHKVIPYQDENDDIPDEYYYSGGDLIIDDSMKPFAYHNVRHWAHSQSSEQDGLVNMLTGTGWSGKTNPEHSIARLNKVLGTSYTTEDIPALNGLIRNYFKYQVNHGDIVDELVESRGTEITTQLTGYSVNTLLDDGNTLGDINKMLTQSNLSQFTIDGVINGSDEWKEIEKDIFNPDTQGKFTDGQNFRFKQITQPGISTGTPSRFMLELSDGKVYTMTENYGMEREFGGGFTYSVLNSIQSQNPLIMMQEAAAKDVQRKIVDGTYQVTGDGSIRVIDYLSSTEPLVRANIQNLFRQQIQQTQGYTPDFSQFDAEEAQAYKRYEDQQVMNYRKKIEKIIVWHAHMQLVNSSSPEVPIEYTGIKDVAELMRILEVDYEYLVTLQNYGLELPSSLITNVGYANN